jgi:tetratricopeptide (TPR) repeat protein
MLIIKGPAKKSEMSVIPTTVEVVLAEGISGPLSLTLPPLEDLREMDLLRGSNLSLTDATFAHAATGEEWFRGELLSLLKKEGAYGKSTVYLEKLANLALLAGDAELEARFLSKVLEIEPKGRALNRLGENYIARHLSEEAEKIFQSLDLLRDVHANLRVAFFNVRRNNVTAAEIAVKRAIDIDPFDYGARLFNGSLCLVQGRFGEAIHNFRVAEEGKPNSAVLQSNIAIAYALMKNNGKALASAKRAVTLDPLNQNAVCLLADLAYSENSNDDAISALRYLTTFEQKNASVWSRLARALLSIGNMDEAILALRRQGSIVSDAEVFNNLGVAYHRKGVVARQKAYDSFRHAMLSESSSDKKLALVASRNLCALLLEDREYKDLGNIARAAIEVDVERFALKDRVVSDLYVFRVMAEIQCGRTENAVHIAHQILTERPSVPALTAWLVTWLISFYSLHDDSSAALRLIDENSDLIGKLRPEDQPQRNALINNIAFALAELGRLDDAENYLQLISNRFHVDAYPTATLGLLHMKRDHLEKAASLYEEAVGLARSEEEKARIRQKLNLEMGQHYFRENQTLANRYFDKVIAQKNGAPELTAKATKLRTELLGGTNGRLSY